MLVCAPVDLNMVAAPTKVNPDPDKKNKGVSPVP